MRDISRRQLLLLTSGFAVFATIPAKKLFAANNQYQKQIDTFVGGNKLSFFAPDTAFGLEHD